MEKILHHQKFAYAARLSMLPKIVIISSLKESEVVDSGSASPVLVLINRLNGVCGITNACDRGIKREGPQPHQSRLTQPKFPGGILKIRRLDLHDANRGFFYSIPKERII